MQERKVDVAILGSGSAGLFALSKVRPAGKSFALINGGHAGTTCARVGCMPSKAAIQVAEDFSRQAVYKRMGIENYQQMHINVEDSLEYIRDIRDSFVDRVLSNSTDNMGDEFIEAYAHFVEPHVLETDDGQRITADKIIIATGSSPIIPQHWQPFRDRIVTTDEFFEQESFPRSVAVIGLGVIGLELGQALARLGVDTVGIDQVGRIGGISDPDVNKVAVDILSKDFPLWLGQPAEISEEADGRLRVTAGANSTVVDKLLVSIGRRPNLDSLQLENAGIGLNEHGRVDHDHNTMQVGDSHIFIAGDVSGHRAILHEAAAEGRIAGFNAASDTITAFRRQTPFSITFCEPNIVSVGARYDELDLDTAAIGEMMVAPVGRALIMGKNKGLIRLYADKASGKLLGAEMITPKGENLAHDLAWCIEQDMTVGDMLRLPYYHPVMEEALQAALGNLYGKVDAKNEGPMMELRAL